ncbi:MAG: SDR family oxidoreductase [Patescibacteria group bacterium]|nr:SDR family oxidoreductase [Patescibacteria group bacterium]
MSIKDKVVIVTGASSGIGLATAKLLTQKGAKVALVARSKEKIEKISKELPLSFPVATDVSKENNVKEMMDKVKNHYGRIDILINNAGRGYDAPVEKTQTDKFRQLFELNVVGPLVAMQAVIPIMRKQGGGMIVNISSGTSLMYLPNMSAYSSTKRMINALSLTAREELKKDSIIVNVVYPYITLTDFEKNMLEGNDFVKPAQGENSNLPPADSAEFIAKKILEVIKTEKAQQYAHEWMRKLG